MSNKQIINGYTVWESRFYFENLEQKPYYSKIVIDNQGKEIAIVEYDRITNQPKGAYKEFRYGNKQIPGAAQGELFPEGSEIYFNFSDDGKIESILMNYDIINNPSRWENLNKFLEEANSFLQGIGVTSEQLYYFTHVEPLVPNF